MLITNKLNSWFELLPLIHTFYVELLLLKIHVCLVFKMIEILFKNIFKIIIMKTELFSHEC